MKFNTITFYGDSETEKILDSKENKSKFIREAIKHFEELRRE